MKTPTNKKMLKIKHLCCVIAAVLFSFGAYADQTAWYVKADGSASADGSSWDNATTLQQAFRLVTAGTVTNWNSIVLEAGTVENPKVYDLSSAETFDESTAFFVVNDKSYVRLTTSAEDLDPRKTVIRGARSTLGEVQCPFMKSSGYFRFEGVTLREFSTVSGYSLCQRVSGSVNATNCVFAANFGTNAVNDTAYGAMFNNPNGTFTGCLFTNNAAWPIKNNDGSVPCSCIAFGDTATTLLKDCRFVDNHGAFMFSQNSNSSYPTFTNCTFAANDCGICVRFYMANPPTFEDCDFLGNNFSSTTLYAIRGGTGIRNCRFSGNTQSGNGSMVYGATCENCEFVGNYGKVCGLANSCVFSNNTSSTSLFDGNLTDCLILSNRVSGQMLQRLDGKCQYVTQCTVVSNYIGGEFFAGANYSYSQGTKPSLYVRNSLFAGNTCAQKLLAGRDGVFLIESVTVADNVCGNSYAAIDHDSGGAKSVILNSIVVGNPPYDFNDNVSTKVTCTNILYGTQRSDAGFMSATKDATKVENRAVVKFNPQISSLNPYGYALKGRSPAINAGENSVSSYTAESTDLTKVISRIINEVIDLGCYEFEPSDIGFMILVR